MRGPADPAEDAPRAIDPGGWAPYLDPGERLLWQGRPATGLRFRRSDLFMVPFSVFWGGFAIMWVAMAVGMDAPWFMVAFGLPFVGIGLYLLAGRFFWDAFVRSRTRYALTDRRAFVAKSALGRQLRSWPIDPLADLELRAGPESTIVFARETRARPRRGRHAGGVRVIEHAFEFIPDGDRVYGLLRAVQRARAREGSE